LGKARTRLAEKMALFNWKVNFWKFDKGQYSQASDKELANPSFVPLIVFTQHASRISATVPILYENGELYFIYNDAITQEQIKEKVELRGDGYKGLQEEAEDQLAAYFKKQNGS
jgi:hypothetical protein